MSDEIESREPVDNLSRRIAEQEATIAELHRLLDTTPDALVVVDEAGDVVLVNRQAEQLFGHQRADLLGTPIERLLPESFRGDHRKHRRHYAGSPHVRPMGAGLDLKALHRDGREIPVEISLSPLELGGRRLFASAVRDATSRVEIEARLREARRVAESATQAKTRFIAAASHDLRQPLQAASIYLELATSPTIDAGRREEAIERTRRCVQTLSDLLNRIMHVSKLDAGTVVARKGTVEVGHLFAQLRDQHAPAAAARGLELRVVESTACARSDRVLLQQLMENLVSNAVRYTEQGGVLLGCRRRGANLVLQVWDTGPGIAAEHREAIFDEFRRLGGRGEQADLEVPGMGLGLAIVRRLEAILDHPVSLRSRVGRGSRFEVVVPAAVGGVEPPREVVARRRTRSRTGLVALVDDNAEVLEAVRTVLEVAGHEVVAATSLDGLLAALKQRGDCPDVILTDYRLSPGTTGLDVIARLRRELSRPLPAVVLTGDSSFSVLEHMRSEIGFDLLAKPVVTRDLLATVARRVREAEEDTAD